MQPHHRQGKGGKLEKEYSIIHFLPVMILWLWSSLCHCHPIISYFIKIRNGLFFVFWLIQFVLVKNAIKWLWSGGWWLSW